MPRGSRPGERRGGRKIGAPNKFTGDAREAFKMVYDGRIKDLDRWIVETAEGFEAVHFLSDGTKIKYIKRDPGKAADLMIKIAEHFVPKLNRTEFSGANGERLTVNVAISGIKAARGNPDDEG